MMYKKNGRPIRILLVEDNPGDARLAIEALRAGKVENELLVVEDGVRAMECLCQQGEFVNRARPDLILLDLNLPKKNGREVLAEIKADEDLKRIPVVVLTTSKDEQDVLKSYELNANCYVSKPVDFDQFIDVVRSIENFWLSVVTLPREKTS